jgi:NAD(P)-dependent dehydrogenase (short-subunit alcohol dehydrogenase family)
MRRFEDAAHRRLPLREQLGHVPAGARHVRDVERVDADADRDQRERRDRRRSRGVARGRRRAIDEPHPHPRRDERRAGEHREMERAPVWRRRDEAELRRCVAHEDWMYRRADPEQHRPEEQRHGERRREASHYIPLRMSEVSDSMYSAAAMRGRVCLVTGANRGLGKATALGLARQGATVVLLGRDAMRVALASDDVRRESDNPDVSYLLVDLGSLASVRKAADEIARRFRVIHVLVNNAGVNLARRVVGPDGFEMTFAVNHLGPFLLTNLLLPLLRAAAPSRIVNVTSWFERFGRIDFDDLHAARKRYGALGAYYQSKLANALFTYELAERVAGTGITVNCVDPGLAATDLLRDRVWWSPRWLQPVWRTFLLSADRGARAAIHAATAPELAPVSGLCLGPGGRARRTSGRSHDQHVRQRLWDVSAGLTGLTDD